MAELGPDAERFHEEVGAYARELGVDEVIGIGPLAGRYGARAWTASTAESIELVLAVVQPGDVVLVKASRSVGLEIVADA
ncbi:MAG: UDP-N-acetylmuramoyl-tripeptide--D-alanyl-D-alanine ligase, partial [Actinobacteria bacterium]